MKNFKIYGLYVVLILILSCNKDKKIETYEINDTSFLVLETEKGLRNQELSLMLKGANEEDYTDLATFYVNESPINGNTFSSTSEGFFEVYAEYNMAGIITTTPIQNVEVFIPKRKVLIEDYTANWCGPCVRIISAINDVKELSNEIVIVSIHGNSIVSSVDPLTIDEGILLKNYFQILGYPTGVINRNVEWENPNFQFLISQPIAFAGVDVDTSISINSQLTGVDLAIEIKVVSEHIISSKKIVVFLLEDGILLDQANGYYNTQPDSDWYQMGDPIVDFEHNDVLRMSLTDPLGDAIANTAAFDVFSSNYSVAIPSEFNPSNLKIAVIVVNQDDTAVNAQIASINDNKGFE